MGSWGDQTGESLKCHVQSCPTSYDLDVASMFDTIADMLRGSAPDDLAHALGTDRTQTRRAMEIGLPALITGLRDKTLEPGGAQNLASMLGDADASVPGDIDAYLAAGDPARGAAMLDVAFGDRGEPALGALSAASGLSTRLLAQVMSVLAPLATGTVAAHAERSPDGLRSYLGDAVTDLEGKGFGRVVELVSPPGLDMASVADVVTAPAEAPVQMASGDHEADVDPPQDDDLFFDVPDDQPDDAIIVEGAFFDAADELLGLDDSAPDDSALGDFSMDLDDPTEAIELGGSMPDFGAEVANVAPAGVVIADDAAVSGSTITYADSGIPEVDAAPDEVEGSGLSGMGWLWWLIGAVLGLIILGIAISQCGGSDGEISVAPGDDTTAVATPTPDPLVAERQTTLDGILLEYPNVDGEVFGDVAVLNGSVADETERALLDQAVRSAGLGIQNNVTASDTPAGGGAQGYSLNDLIDAQPELSTLRALLDQAGFAEALSGGGEFTLFAPTNDAFEAVSDQVAELQNDPEALKAVLRYHLLVGAQDAASISATASLPTQLDGQNIEVDASTGSIVLNGSVSVLVGDAAARNGVLHIVSSVLLPQAAPAELPEEIGAALGLAPITFASGGSDLTADGQVELDKVAAFLLETPGNIEIGGHTDSDGEPGYNQTLSQERADAVKSYLASQGVAAESMTAIGFGEDLPIAANDTPENKAKNRRIEFRPI